MSHLRHHLLVARFRGARSLWLPTSARSCRSMFTTTIRRSSVEHPKEQGDKTQPEHRQFLPHDDTSKVTYSLMGIVATLASCLLVYSAYSIYELATSWPESLRQDLRRGIKYKNKHDRPLSIQHFQQAWETSKSIPLNEFGQDPLLKTTGIAIVLAGVLEDDGKKEEAYKIYQEALSQLQSAYLDLLPDAPQPDLGGMDSLKLLTPPERMRAAALAHKLGSLASELKKPEEEKYLTWSVNAILMAVMEAPAGSKIPPNNKRLHLMGADMRLPSWARVHDISAPFEALGTFYADRGNNSYALPLYLQAISILIPPPPMESSPEDRCRGAMLMRDVAVIVAMNDDSPDSFAQATSWSQKGLDVATAARQSKKCHECNTAYLLSLFQLASFQQMSGEHHKARELWATFVKEAKVIKSKSFIEVGKQRLQDLDKDIESRNKDKTF